MGGLGSLFTPDINIPEPPAVPTADNSESQEDREYRRRIAAAKQGKASTILTTNTPADETFGSNKKYASGKNGR